MAPHSAQRRRPARGGFTIIELLIVITIISVLLALTVRVIGAVITVARESATQTTIRKIQGLLGERSQALQRHLQRESFVTQSPEYVAIRNDSNLANVVAPLQKICAKKLIVRRYFPQSIDEISNADLANFHSKEFQQMVADWKADPANVPKPTNAEILYEMLTASDALGGSPIGTDAFSTSEVQITRIEHDPPVTRTPHFVDGWGRPLYFYRCPTRLFRPTGAPTVNDITNGVDLTVAKSFLSQLPFFSGDQVKDVCRDPDDPLRFTLRLFPGNFETYPNPPNPTTPVAPWFHTPTTYHAMLVVSAGADGNLGLYEPDNIDMLTNIRGDLGMVEDANALVDNITYLNVRAGGK